MKRYDLNLLHVFDALAQAGSVKAAADLLNLSPPAMSHALARLRETTGDPLLVRAGRRLVPTPRALEMAEATRMLVKRANDLLAPRRDDASWSLEERKFVLVAPDEIAVAYAARLLARIRSTMPNASLGFMPVDASSFDRLRQGSVDLEIQPAGRQPSEIRMEVLRQQSALVAMRQNHPLARRPLTLARYAKASHVVLSMPSEFDSAVDRALGQARSQREAALRVASSYAALSAASQSDLLATTPASIARAVAQGLGLVCAAPPFAIPAHLLQLAWHPRMEADPAHTWLRECVRSVLGSPEAPASQSARNPRSVAAP